MHQRARLHFFQSLAAVLVLTVLSGCAGRLNISVQDVDTYHVVKIGAASYIAGDGLAVTDTGRRSVTHEVGHIPGAVLTVSVDPNPPRDFRFDADAEKRKFVKALPRGYLTSAQYAEVDDWVRARGAAGELPRGEEAFEKKIQERVRVNARGTTPAGEEIAGAMIVLREMGRTATVKVTGPYSEAPKLNILVERIADSVEWESSRRARRSF